MRPLRILLVHPGASMSTADVWSGLRAGLAGRGHQVLDYALDERIQVAGGYLHWLWKRSGKRTDLKPRDGQVLYRAGEELITRALRVEPDVVLVVSAMYLHPDVLVLLRRAGLRVAVLLTESPYDDEKQARILPWVDVAWTNERVSASTLGVHYLPHAWNAAVHQAVAAVDPHVPAHDVVFVGTGFQERIDLLASVDWTGIDLALYGSWDLLGSRNHLRAYIRGSYVDNRVTAQLYRRAKIGLNLYRTSKGFGRDAARVTAAASLNPRAYELAATGCFTISDFRPEVAEKFGTRVPTFTAADELRPLLDRWLSDDHGRQVIQADLPACVASDTWDARAAQVERDLIDAGIVARHEPHTETGAARRAVGR
jgi:spore maturation protein CgeB